MSKKEKIILGSLVGLVLLCFCTCVGGWLALRLTGNMLGEAMLIEDSQQAAALARAMVDYELPTGYQETAAMNMGFMKMIIITADTMDFSAAQRPVIMMMGMSADIEVNEAAMREQMRQSMQRSSSSQGLEMVLVEERRMTIRGQDVLLLMYEGEDTNGVRMKQVITSMFTGKNASVMVLIIGQEATWDQEAVDTFLTSIR